PANIRRYNVQRHSPAFRFPQRVIARGCGPRNADRRVRSWERNVMTIDSQHVMPWRIEDIDLTRIDRQKAAANEDLLLLLCAASFIESGTDLYTSNLTAYFQGDPEVSAWLNQEWEPEELQHG